MCSKGWVGGLPFDPPAQPTPARQGKPGRRERALHALAQMGLNPTENVEFYTPRAGEERLCGGRAHAGGPVGSGTDTPPSPVAGGAPASWTRRGPPQHLPAQNAPRSWLFVPLLLDAAGQLQVAASAAWRSHAVLGAHWGSCASHARRAPCRAGPGPRSRITAPGSGCEARAMVAPRSV